MLSLYIHIVVFIYIYIYIYCFRPSLYTALQVFILLSNQHLVENISHSALPIMLIKENALCSVTLVFLLLSDDLTLIMSPLKIKT